MTIHYKIGEKDTRPWGTWEITDIGTNYIIKKITVLPHQKLSLQLHHHRNEHWIIVSGTVLVTIGDSQKTISENTHLYIPKETKHRLENPTDESICFIEIQTGELLDETDIIRFEDIYGRCQP